MLLNGAVLPWNFAQQKISYQNLPITEINGEQVIPIDFFGDLFENQKILFFNLTIELALRGTKFNLIDPSPVYPKTNFDNGNYFIHTTENTPELAFSELNFELVGITEDIERLNVKNNEFYDHIPIAGFKIFGLNDQQLNILKKVFSDQGFEIENTLDPKPSLEDFFDFIKYLSRIKIFDEIDLRKIISTKAKNFSELLNTKIEKSQIKSIINKVTEYLKNYSNLRSLLLNFIQKNEQLSQISIASLLNDPKYQSIVYIAETFAVTTLGEFNEKNIKLIIDPAIISIYQTWDLFESLNKLEFKQDKELETNEDLYPEEFDDILQENEIQEQDESVNHKKFNASRNYKGLEIPYNLLFEKNEKQPEKITFEPRETNDPFKKAVQKDLIQKLNKNKFAIVAKIYKDFIYDDKYNAECIKSYPYRGKNIEPPKKFGQDLLNLVKDCQNENGIISSLYDPKSPIEVVISSISNKEKYGKTELRNKLSQLSFKQPSQIIDQAIMNDEMIYLDRDYLITPDKLKISEDQLDQIYQYLAGKLANKKYLSLTKLKDYRNKLPTLNYKMTPEILCYIATKKLNFKKVELPTNSTLKDPLIITDEELSYDDLIKKLVPKQIMNKDKKAIAKYFAEHGLIREGYQLADIPTSLLKEIRRVMTDE